MKNIMSIISLMPHYSSGNIQEIGLVCIPSTVNPQPIKSSFVCRRCRPLACLVSAQEGNRGQTEKPARDQTSHALLNSPKSLI